MNPLLKELLNFSKTNWWVYILLCIALGIVVITGKGNILEILILFLLNLGANVLVMAAIGNYSEKKNKTGAVFHISSTTLFAFLGIYSLIQFNQAQYIVWQVSFLLAAIKAMTFYNFNKDLHFLNPYSIGSLNAIFLIIFLIYGNNLGFDTGLSSILLAIGFSFVSTGLVSISDSFRYWGNYIGSFLIIAGASLGTYASYIAGSINGVDMGYFMLTLTAFVFFSKLLPKYIGKKS